MNHDSCKSRPASARSRRLRIEALEDRRMLAILTVDTELDVVNAGDGLTSLREAIATANAMSDGDTIEFLPALSGKTILLSQGELDIAGQLRINGLGANLLTLDAQENSRIFDIDAPGTTIENFSVTITGLTLTGGKVVGNNQPGGAIRSVTRGDLIVERSSILGNSTTSQGGGIYAIGRLVLAHSVVADNESSIGGGGISSGADVSVSASTISNNQVTNAGYQGGGIFATGMITITDSIVTSNRAIGGVGAIGGGISGNGGLDMINTTVSDNMSTSGAGGIRVQGVATITNSTIFGNSTTGGGAVGGGIFSQGSLTLVGTTVSGNSTKGSIAHAGGVFGGNVLVVRYSTITDNETTGGNARGGGIYSTRNLTIEGSIIAGNRTVSLNPDLSFATDDPEINFSLIGDTSDTDVTAMTGLGNLLDINPQLAPLADNGGLARTHRLLPSSPARDAGDLDAEPGLGGVPLNDQRGLPYTRVFGGRIDIGAVEYQPLSTDFDGDGDVDGLDFLAWQIGHGTSDANRSDGDSNYDGEVDSTDLAGWEVTYGDIASRQSVDFNGDGDIDGRDFLAWQRGYVAISPNGAKAHGDADNDRDVDAADLAAWENAYAQGWELALVSSTLFAAEPAAFAEAPDEGGLHALLVDLALTCDGNDSPFGVRTGETLLEDSAPTDTQQRHEEAAALSERPSGANGDIAVSRPPDKSEMTAAALDDELVVTQL